MITQKEMKVIFMLNPFKMLAPDPKDIQINQNALSKIHWFLPIQISFKNPTDSKVAEFKAHIASL